MDLFTTLVLLFLPKMLSVLLIWCKGAKPYGGFVRVFISLILEMLFSVLLAPVRMLFHTLFVVSAFLGLKAVWDSPQRDDDSTPWSEAFRRHGSQMLLGIVWAAGMGYLDLNFLWWLAPIVGSLILSPIVSVISSRATVGLASRRAKLFLIPEEFETPQELIDTDNYVLLNRQRVLENGFMHALFHPSFNALATALATARHLQSDLLEHARERQIDQLLSESPEKSSANQRLLAISDPVVLARLHSRLWQQQDKYRQWHDSYAKVEFNPNALQVN